MKLKDKIMTLAVAGFIASIVIAAGWAMVWTLYIILH